MIVRLKGEGRAFIHELGNAFQFYDSPIKSKWIKRDPCEYYVSIL